MWVRPGAYPRVENLKGYFCGQGFEHQTFQLTTLTHRESQREPKGERKKERERVRQRDRERKRQRKKTEGRGERKKDR